MTAMDAVFLAKTVYDRQAIIAIYAKAVEIHKLHI